MLGTSWNYSLIILIFQCVTAWQDWAIGQESLWLSQLPKRCPRKVSTTTSWNCFIAYCHNMSFLLASVPFTTFETYFCFWICFNRHHQVTNGWVKGGVCSPWQSLPILLLHEPLAEFRTFREKITASIGWTYMNLSTLRFQSAANPEESHESDSEVKTSENTSVEDHMVHSEMAWAASHRLPSSDALCRVWILTHFDQFHHLNLSMIILKPLPWLLTAGPTTLPLDQSLMKEV